MVRWLIFENVAQTFRVALADDAVKHMLRLCNANRSRETGGILIGSYSHDQTTAEVVEASGPPADSRFGRDWFHRGTDGLEELLIARWDQESRRHYVGEWHFHTANVPWPSPQDEKQMREVAHDARYRCAQPLLVIVCPVLSGQWIVKCFVFPNGASHQEFQIVNDPALYNS